MLTILAFVFAFTFVPNVCQAQDIITNNLNIYIGPNYVTVGFASTANYSISGVTKHDVIIQKALDDVAKQNGGTVHILEGEYNLFLNLFIGDNIHLKGDGMEKTVLKLADNAPAWRNGTYKRSGFVRARLSHNLIVSNLTLDGNKNNQIDDEDHNYGRYGLFTEGCNNVWFDNVKITSFQGYGFDPHGWKDGNIWGEYLTITNCLSEFNEWDGYTLDQTTNIDVMNCTSRFNGRHGFNIVTGSKYVNLQNNTAIGNGFYDPHGGSGCGYMTQNNKFYGTSFVRVMENYAMSNKKADMCINDVHNVIIRDNVFDKSCTCFHAVNAKTIEFTHNQCNTNKFVRSSDSVIVTDYNARIDSVLISDNTFKKTSCNASDIDPTDNTNTWDNSSGEQTKLEYVTLVIILSFKLIYYSFHL